MPHRSFLLPSGAPPGADLEQALSAVSPKVRRAALEAHRVLEEAGIAHLLVGGLAVGAYGYACATQDVDFLVSDDAFVHHKGIVSFAPGVPIQIDGVQIDYLAPTPGLGMAELLDAARGRPGLSVIPIEQLVYMKLLANRPKDHAAIIGLIGSGIDTDEVRGWLSTHAPGLVTRLDRLIKKAGG